jgi:hypothetical protein
MKNNTGVTLTSLMILESNGKASILADSNSSITNGSSIVYSIASNVTNVLFLANDATNKPYGVFMLNVNGKCQLVRAGESSSSNILFTKTSSPASLIVDIPIIPPVRVTNPIAPPAGKTLPQLATFPTSVQVTNYCNAPAMIGY